MFIKLTVFCMRARGDGDGDGDGDGGVTAGCVSGDVAHAVLESLAMRRSMSARERCAQQPRVTHACLLLLGSGGRRVSNYWCPGLREEQLT